MKIVEGALVGSLVVGLIACGSDGDASSTAGADATAGTDSQSTDSSMMTAGTVTTTAGAPDGTASGASNGSTSDAPGSTGSDPDTGAATGSTGTIDDTGAPGSTSMDTDGSTDDGGSSDEGSTGEGSTGEGSTGGQAIVDTDDDDIPDDDDPFPNDADLPGLAAPGVVYAHTASTLYTMEVAAPYTIATIGAFTFPGGSSGQVTDLAIDRWGVLYIITFNDLHVCEPDTAACHYLADIPSTSNGLTFVPPGVLAVDDDELIGIANSGDWRHMELAAGMVTQMVLGSYGGGYTSAGDAFSIEGVGTYAAVNAAAVPGGNVIVEVDPTDGSVLAEVGTLAGYTTVYGLAGWSGSIFAFNSGGEVLLIDPLTGAFEVINDTAYTWWGAGVRTLLPS